MNEYGKESEKSGMKSKLAQKLLEKLGGIDPSSIESITIQLMMKGQDGEMEEMQELAPSKKKKVKEEVMEEEEEEESED